VGIVLKAFAKINLTLKIVSKRADGYHDIESIMQKVDLHDEVILEEAENASITVRTDDPRVPDGPLNVAYRAASSMQSRYAPFRGVNVFIRKRIPVAAGLGGGSADAASLIVGLARMWGLRVPLAELLAVGAEIGSDVPFAMSPPTALVRGRGEIVHPLRSPDPFWVVLAKPREGLLTRDVYEEFDLHGGSDPGDAKTVVEGMALGDLRIVARGVGNALAAPAARLAPTVGVLLRTLQEEGALAASVSGSGPTVFGIAEDEEHARSMKDAVDDLDILETALVAKTLDV